MKKKLIILFISSVLCSNLFFAEEVQLAEKTRVSDNLIFGSGEVFKLNSVTDSILLGGGIILASTDLVLDKIVKLNQVDFSTDLFKSGNCFSKDEVNSFDRLFMNDYSKTLDYLGTGFEGLSLLTPLCLLTVSSDEWFTIGTMYAETLIFAYGFKELGKLVVNRARPYMYYDNYPTSKTEDGDWNDSFFSGHSTLSFAAASFASFVYCNYFPDSDWKVSVVALSYTLACTTSVLRVLSGNHFVTDVLVGAVVGTATGLLVPYLHTLTSTGKNKSNFSAFVMPTGVRFEIKL